MELTEKEKEAAGKISLSLDVKDPFTAIQLAKELSGLYRYSKVNSVFVQAANSGLPLIARLHEIEPREDGNVIVDLKWHDSPGTIYNYSVALSRMVGVSMFTVHLDGGRDMCIEALRGARDATTNLKRVGEDGFYVQKSPKVIGITELTSSDFFGYQDAVMRKADQARRWGLDGITAPGEMAGRLAKEFGDDFTYVFPGMVWGGLYGKEQVHIYSPEKIVTECKNCVLVAGRAVTGSEDRKRTLYDILGAVAAEL